MLLVACLSLSLAGDNLARADDGSCDPRYTIDYAVDRAEARFSLDLSSACFETPPRVSVDIKIWRRQVTGTTQVSDSKLCEGTELCEFEVVLPHQIVEHDAEYETSWQYLLIDHRPLGGGRFQSDRCSSYVIVFGCPLSP